jgi:hypothetical protein
VHQRAIACILQHFALLQAFDEAEGQLAADDHGPYCLCRRLHQHLHPRRTSLRIAAGLARDHLTRFEPGEDRGVFGGCGRRCGGGTGDRAGHPTGEQECDGQESLDHAVSIMAR